MGTSKDRILLIRVVTESRLLDRNFAAVLTRSVSYVGPLLNTVRWKYSVCLSIILIIDLILMNNVFYAYNLYTLYIWSQLFFNLKCARSIKIMSFKT